MKQSKRKQGAPIFRDVIACGSILSPMAQWKPLVAAVSKECFEAEILRRDEWIAKFFRDNRVEFGDYDHLARVVGWNGLKMKKTETTEEYCHRVFRRMPAWRKPLPDALKPRGGTPRQS
jgi:hypothetical protein